MRLTRAQREAVISWVAEGLQSDEINHRAAGFTPPFQLSRTTLYHYRKTRAKPLAQLKAEGEAPALSSGLAVAEERVRRLQELAEKLWLDLMGEGGRGLWLKDVKQLGSERYEFERYNAAQVQAFRDVLDDIAREVGGRQVRIDQTQRIEIGWNWPPPPKSNI